MKQPSVSVIIPAYKQTDLFVRNLARNLPELAGTQIIIINDDPETSIVPRLEAFTTDAPIQLIENRTNVGFGPTVNIGAKNATGEFLLLLNTDVLLARAPWRESLNHFNDERVFAVSFAQKEHDGRIVGRNEVYFKHGFFYHRENPDISFGETGWAEGGSCVIRRSMFEELGGFDEAYAPFYWEDVDLSYRAKARGWKVLFDPRILVEHHHESTISSYFARSRIMQISKKNQRYFTRKFASPWQRFQMYFWELVERK
jgi:GT2 family glycosyltransferase